MAKRNPKVDIQIAESSKQHKISHTGKILSEQTLQEKNILPGLVVRFAYNSPKAYDRRPLVMVFQSDGNLIHGVNFNYLHESRVQRFGKLAQSLVPIEYENILKLKEDYTRLQLSSRRRASSVDGKLLYNTVMPRDVYFRNAYRTYKLSTIASLKLVDYNWGVTRGKGQQGKRTTEQAIGKLASKKIPGKKE